MMDVSVERSVLHYCLAAIPGPGGDTRPSGQATRSEFDRDLECPCDPADWILLAYPFSCPSRPESGFVQVRRGER